MTTKILTLKYPRFDHPAGTVVYQAKFYDYGLASDDERCTGMPHRSVTLNPDGRYPFFTVPTRHVLESDAPTTATQES